MMSHEMMSLYKLAECFDYIRESLYRNLDATLLMKELNFSMRQFCTTVDIGLDSQLFSSSVMLLMLTNTMTDL